jgi:hypothetical protein
MIFIYTYKSLVAQGPQESALLWCSSWGIVIHIGQPRISTRRNSHRGVADRALTKTDEDIH